MFQNGLDVCIEYGLAFEINTLHQVNNSNVNEFHLDIWINSIQGKFVGKNQMGLLILQKNETEELTKTI